jgi:hypothetical protein
MSTKILVTIDIQERCRGTECLDVIILHSLPLALPLVPCFAYSSTLKREATCSSETSVVFQWTVRRYIPEDRTLHIQRCENLKF